MHRKYNARLEESKQLRSHIEQAARGPLHKWLRAYLVPLVLYYALGCVLYHYLETDGDGNRWAPFDVVYFLTSTATTVGYGDFAPRTWPGRLLTTFYAPFGTIVILGSLLEPVGEVRRLDSSDGCSWGLTTGVTGRSTRTSAAALKKEGRRSTCACWARRNPSRRGRLAR